MHIQVRNNLLSLTSLWPDTVFSNLPSYAPQILMSLSAAGKKTCQLGDEQHQQIELSLPGEKNHSIYVSADTG